MKTLRRLAFLALFAVAAPAFAQTPLPAVPGGTPTPSADAADRLGELVKGEYKGTTVEGKGDAVTFFLPKMPHTLEDRKETMQWSVYIRLEKRADRPKAVRIFFPCQAVPANAHPDRLADLMNMNGAIQDSPAYFIVTSGKVRTLALVIEMSADGLDLPKLDTEIKGLFRAAERTLNLWGGDLSKPLSKKDDKKAEKSPLTGEWNAHDPRYNSGSAPPRPFLAGLNSLYFTTDGKVKAYVQNGGEKDGKNIDIMNGTYTLEGDQLSMWFDGFKTSEQYTVKIKGDKLTLTPDKGNISSVTDKEITLNKW